MFDLFQLIQTANSIAIAGHVRPDGDCVGACLSMYNYLTCNYNIENNKRIDLYLEKIPEEFTFIKNVKDIKEECREVVEYDLIISLDCGSADRLGVCGELFPLAKETVNIDHHISNTKFAKYNHVMEASSTCEVIFDLFDTSKITKEIAESLYLGIVHDTGVFKHSNTTEKTMQIAGKLISLGAEPSKIIDETFYQKTYVQNQVLGRCLTESFLLLDGKIVVASISKKTQEFYNVSPADTNGVIDQLRVTKGVEVAIFLREENFHEYKVSMRSNGIVDVSKIAVFFGGGGHIKAAGCSMTGSLHDVINNLAIGIEHQLSHDKSK